ncbi:TPA: flagellar biosynthesis protein FlgG, partial [Campylobacter jejuni]|nr:flagellar biosynthesis protein FlgG [Campylobacter jejuni]ECQ5536221.1 flagellar biosynthesis protein FlgG [Campylobacter jejuni]EHA2294308.1 flagellar biosynthesis protein FlgG [Campylobacter jejuni]EKY8610408.1 flagellar biosynthesis protein FlgG [Campylobacter jejuni]MCW1669748.1 flagellar biosynthesis protein FlgG [Campylobacter jejuni]
MITQTMQSKESKESKENSKISFANAFLKQ